MILNRPLPERYATDSSTAAGIFRRIFGRKDV
jgi:hypothetical protein